MDVITRQQSERVFEILDWKEDENIFTFCPHCVSHLFYPWTKNTNINLYDEIEKTIPLGEYTKYEIIYLNRECSSVYMYSVENIYNSIKKRTEQQDYERVLFGNDYLIFQLK